MSCEYHFRKTVFKHPRKYDCHFNFQDISAFKPPRPPHLANNGSQKYKTHIAHAFLPLLQNLLTLKWDVTPLIRRGSNFFAALYCSLLLFEGETLFIKLWLFLDLRAKLDLRSAKTILTARIGVRLFCFQID